MAKVRFHGKWPVREVLGEFMGTFLLVFLGVGGGCVVAVNFVHMSHSDLLRSIIWALAVACAYHVAGNMSGGHFNPCITVGFSVVGKFHPGLVLPYILVQMLAAMCGAAAVIFMFRDALYSRFNQDLTEANIDLAATFGGQPDPDIHWITYLCTSFTGSMLLLIIIHAITDPKNMQVPHAFLGVFIGIFGYGFMNLLFSFVWTGDPFLNPARDIAPRLVNFSQGFNRITSAWFAVTNVLASLAGASFGSIIYCFLIEYQHPWDHKDIAKM